MKPLVLASVALLSVGAAAQPKPKKSAAKAPAKPTQLRFVVAPSGNEARYRVRERLMGKELDNDAIGVTKDVTGRLVVQPNGTVLKDSSRIVVVLTGLKSDQSRRDGYVQRRLLDTQNFPHVELVPATFQGLSSPIPAGASKTFALVGDLTVRGVTRPTTWQVTARTDGGDLVGTAATAFTFKDFNLDQPRVPVVLSVADTIKLEYDFRFTPDTTK
jgi:polyisoprenoid-binding protein YceI